MDAAIEILAQDRLSQVVLPIFFAAVLIEALWSRLGNRGLYKASDSFASLMMLIASGVVEILPKIVLVALMVELHEISPLLNGGVRYLF